VNTREKLAANHSKQWLLGGGKFKGENATRGVAVLVPSTEITIRRLTQTPLQLRRSVRRGERLYNASRSEPDDFTLPGPLIWILAALKARFKTEKIISRPTKQTKQNENQLHYFVLLECFVGKTQSCAKLSPKVNRAFSAGGLSSSTNPGALPRVRHGESVLWRTNDETAPFGAKQTASDTEEPLQLNRETIWRTNHAWPEAPQYIRVYPSSRVAQLLRGSFVVKSYFRNRFMPSRSIMARQL
jgi:hypothetical protein